MRDLRSGAPGRGLPTFSRPRVVHAAPLDVNALITGMSGTLAGLIPAEIDVVLNLAPECSRALADRAQLEQVLVNLVVNASGAMPGGGRLTIETADVELEASPFHEEPVAEGSYVMLAVTDSGRRVTPETPPQVLAVEVPGIGQGLGATWALVRECNGYIWVYSEPIQGTTFKVYLPRAGDAPPMARPAIAAPAVSAHETILLVEDERGVRQLSKRILNNAGYRVIEAVDGEDAERMFVEHGDAIDLIITDLIMPGCDGHELVRRLQERSAWQKVLFMSGYTEATALDKTNLERGQPFVQKPFTSAELVRQVRLALVG